MVEGRTQMNKDKGEKLGFDTRTDYSIFHMYFLLRIEVNNIHFKIDVINYKNMHFQNIVKKLGKN